MKKIVLFIVCIVVIGVLAMPFVVKKQVLKQIDSEKQVLLKSGVELTVTKDEGYFSSFREFELKIINGEKFRDFVIKRFAEKNPNYKGLVELIQKQSNKDIRPALDGTTFSGNIKNSNLYLNAPLITVSLTKFSDEIMSGINGNKDISKLFKSILDEKLFTFFITLDSNQKISKIVMQDIDKDIKNNGETVNVKLKNHKLNIDIKESLKGVYTLEEESLTANKFLLNTKGIEYKFDYLTQFDNKGSFHLDSFKFKEQNNVIKIGNIDVSNSIKTSNDTLSADVKYAIKNIFMKNNNQFELANVTIKVNIFEVNKNGVVKGTEAYNELIFEPKQDSIEKLTSALEKVLNKGFKADIVASLSGMKFQNMIFDNSDFTLNLQVDKNSYKIDSDAMINALLINGKFTFDEKNIQDIIKLDRSLKRFIELGKKNGSKIVFDYEFKQGILLINGKKI